MIFYFFLFLAFQFREIFIYIWLTSFLKGCATALVYLLKPNSTTFNRQQSTTLPSEKCCSMLWLKITYITEKYLTFEYLSLYMLSIVFLYNECVYQG